METAVLVALALATAVLGVLFVGLLRSHAQILRALHDLGVRADGEDAGTGRLATGGADVVRLASSDTAGAVGGPADDVAGVTPAGDATRLAVTQVAHPTLLAFLSAGCGTCAGFWDELGGGLPEVRSALGTTRIVVVTQGPELESPGAVAKLAGADADVDVVMSTEAWTYYGIAGAPYFVLIDGPSGRVVGEGHAPAWSQVAALLGRAVEDRRHEGRTRRQLLSGAADVPERSDRVVGGTVEP
jgi:hypothetical protein